jgi:hypothetical protein
VNAGSNPSTGPELPPKAIGLGALVQHGGQARQLLLGRAAPEGFRDLALWPVLLLGLPALESSGFFPIAG